MKKINRAQLRGRPLEPMCYNARTTTREYGPKDNRVYCYGVDWTGHPYAFRDGETHPACLECKAHVENSEPPKEG